MFDVSNAPHLDHVFLTVDPATMADIAACELLRDDAFCRFRIKKATSTLLGPYETANVLGESTFVEFFPAEQPPFPGVSLGIVMSFDRPGEAADACHTMVQSSGIGFDFELNRREIDGYDSPQDWYRLLRPKLGDPSPITLFLSEVTENYFDILGARRAEDGSQPRAAYLDAAVGVPHRSDQHFRNITHVTLRLTTARATLLTDALEVLGYTKNSGETGAAVLTGPEATLTVLAKDDQPEGLLELRFSLLTAHNPPGQVLNFGAQSALTLSPDGDKDPSAVWTFTPTALSPTET